MDKGYLLISRKLFEHPFWKEPRVFSKLEAWIDLLRQARYDLKNGTYHTGSKQFQYKRGELVASLRQLGEKWQWGKDKVNNYINQLEKEGMIKRRKGVNNITILTICKYDHYNPLAVKTAKTNREVPAKNNELQKAENNGQSSDPDFEKFTVWLSTNAPHCANLKNFPTQISETQLFELKKQYSSKQIADIILRIENRKDLRKRYTNLYLTVINWLKKEL